MSEPRLSGLVIARWAKDFGISPDVAWRQIREGSVEFRAIVAKHYCTSERMDETQRYVAEPELMDQELDAYLRSKRMSDDHPDYSSLGLDSADHETLYTADDPCRNPHVNRRSK